MNNRFLLALALLPLASLPLSGQENPSPPPQYREEIEVRAIDIDVVVTDRRGNPITNLTRDDFELYENGRRVEIDYFSRIESGEIADLPAAVAELAVQKETPRIPLTWIVYIDDTNVLPQMRNEAMRQLRGFLETTLQRGDRGLVAVNDGRSFKIRLNITDDQQLMMRTLGKIARERVPANPARSQKTALYAQMRRTEFEMGAIPQLAGVGPGRGGGELRDETRYLSQTAGGEIQNVIKQEAARTKFALLALGNLLDALAPVDGRLALVYVGAGFNSRPGADLAAVYRTSYPDFADATWAPRPDDETYSIEREIDRLYDNLSALRVTVYTIHGGDRAGEPVSVEDRGQMEHQQLEQTTDIGAITEGAFAREMAERTGGLYFRVNPALSRQLDTAANDFENYYALGYTPTGKVGTVREIRVEVVGRNGLRVRHRRTVRERTEAEKAAGAAVAAMIRPDRVQQRAVRVAAPDSPAAEVTEANPLGVAVTAERPKRFGGGTGALPFNFSVRLEELSFQRRDDAHHAAFAMHFALVTTDGAVYPLESREQRLAVPAAEIEAASAVQPAAEQHVAWSWHLDMAPIQIPPGVPVYEKGAVLSVTVEDRFGPKRSVLLVPLGDS